MLPHCSHFPYLCKFSVQTNHCTLPKSMLLSCSAHGDFRLMPHEQQSKWQWWARVTAEKFEFQMKDTLWLRPNKNNNSCKYICTLQATTTTTPCSSSIANTIRIAKSETYVQQNNCNSCGKRQMNCGECRVCCKQMKEQWKSHTYNPSHVHMYVWLCVLTSADRQ